MKAHDSTRTTLADPELATEQRRRKPTLLPHVAELRKILTSEQFAIPMAV